MLLQKILKKAVGGALESARKELAIAAATAVNSAAARAIKSRCLSCDREVTPIRKESVGPLPSKEGAQPNLFHAKLNHIFLLCTMIYKRTAWYG